MPLSIRKSSAAMDMTQGPILKKLVVYSVPVVISGILQLLFRAADLVVVGRFTGSDALAAVSASGPVSGLIVTLFMGISVGANVVAAQDIGAKRTEDFRETVHTSIAISLVTGFAMMVLGLLSTDALLHVLSTPEDIFPQAKTYLGFIFLGVPGTIVYNFGAAILRAVGDTRRPMLFMLIAGALNFILNVLLVAGFGMGVEGVAIATALSETLSAALILYVMGRSQEVYRLEWRRLKIHKDKLVKIIRVGLPAGLQGSAFSISYLLVQSSINSLGPTVMAAVTIAWSIDDFCYVGVNALGQAAGVPVHPHDLRPASDLTLQCGRPDVHRENGKRLYGHGGHRRGRGTGDDPGGFLSAVWRVRGSAALCHGLLRGILPGHYFRGNHPGHERLYQHPGICPYRHGHGAVPGRFWCVGAGRACLRFPDHLHKLRGVPALCKEKGTETCITQTKGAPAKGTPFFILT